MHLFLALIAASTASDTLALQADAVVIGRPMEISVKGATPGRAVHFVFGTQQGPGYCPPGAGGECLGIANARLIGNSTANINGEATMQLDVPSSIPEGATAYLQAVVLGAQPAFSEVTPARARHLWSSSGDDGLWIAGLPHTEFVVGAPSLVGEQTELAFNGIRQTGVGSVLEPQSWSTWSLGTAAPIGPGWEVRTTNTGHTGGLFTVGALFGFLWDGTQEVMFRYDPRYGAASATPLTVVGDLTNWYGRTVYDQHSGHIFVFGGNSAGQAWLYEMDPHNNAYVGKVPMNESVVGPQASVDGDILGFLQGPTGVFIRVDPTSGTVQSLSPIGYNPSSRTLYDPENEVFWARGTRNGTPVITGIDVYSGTVLTETELLDTSVIGWQMRKNGNIVGSRWSGQRQELVEIDPYLGTSTFLGVVGDLLSWSGRTLLNEADDRMYLWGNNGTNDSIYVMELSSGNLIDQIVTSGRTYQTGTVLVF